MVLLLLSDIALVDIVFPDPPPLPAHNVVDLRFDHLGVLRGVDGECLILDGSLFENRAHDLSLLEGVRD